MKLYDCAPAPSPRRVRMFLAEKGLVIPVVQVDLRHGEHLEPAFKAINPRAEVPVLELDDGTMISETVAICRYLEELKPEPNLLGATAKERALIAMWDHRVEVEGFMSVAEALRNQAKGFENRALTGPEDFAQIPELAARGRRRIAQFFATLDARLGNSPYVGSDRFSVADITALVVVDFAAWTKETIPTDHKNLQRWHAEVSARPSAKA